MKEKEIYEVQFPEFKMTVDIPKEWQDMSWHNNSCPSFWHKDYEIFVDYDNVEDREFEYSKQFAIFRLVKDSEGCVTEQPEFIFDSNDFEEIKRKLEELP